MRRRPGMAAHSLLLIAGVSLLCGFATNNTRRPIPPPSSPLASSIVVTAAPVFEPLAALVYGEQRFPQGARLLLLRAGKAESLLPEFSASADANVSFDAATVLFSGKKNPGDPWQIWELALADHSVRQVISANADLVRPFYLPGNRIAYARRTHAGFQIEAAWADGSHQLSLTHLRGNALPVDVLLDGRILFESTFPLGAGAQPELYLVYSDGSCVESYRCDHGRARWGAHQLVSGPQSGDVIFSHGRTLARFTSPLAVEAPVAAPAAEYAGMLAETQSGAWIVSARSSDRGRFSLALLHPGAPALQPFFSDRANNLVEPVLLLPRPVPKRHPSGLHDWTAANLLALDVRQSRDGDLAETPTSVRLDAQDENGNAITMGFAPVESDGSFFVHVPGDRPIRFTLLDGSGAAVRAEQGWFWIRSGEQRICVGCHAGPEHAPENRVPQVLLRSTVPVDLTGSTPVTATGGR